MGSLTKENENQKTVFFQSIKSDNSRIVQDITFGQVKLKLKQWKTQICHFKSKGDNSRIIKGIITKF